MATTIISDAKLQIIDNMVVVTLPNGIEDNCQYEIRLKNLQSFDGTSVLSSYTHKVITELTPSYCNVSDVAILVDTFGISESTVLYYIREASKYVDYIIDTADSTSTTTSTEVTFPMKQFVKVKTMIDCLLSAYAKKAAGSGIKGKLGEISFEDTDKYATSIDDLLDDLYAQLKGWEDAIKGYELEGRAAPAYAVKAHKASESDSATFTDIVDSMDRALPVGV